MNNQPRSQATGAQMMMGGRRPGGPMAGRMAVQKPKNTGKTIMRLLRYIGKSRATLISLLVIMAVITVLELIGPLMQSNAIDTFEYSAERGITVHFFSKKSASCPSSTPTHTVTAT